jgi:hypothetical protein
MNESPPGPISFLINEDNSMTGSKSFPVAVNFEAAALEAVSGQVVVYLPDGEQFEVPFSPAPPSADGPFFIIGQIERSSSTFEFNRDEQWIRVPEDL